MEAQHDETAETFEKRMFTTVQSGFTTVSIAVGSATGLFNVMATLGGAKTSQEIADAAGLKERYVREWLGAMVVAGIVDVDSDKNTYFLPPHRHSALCTKDGAGNIGKMTEAIPVLCEAYKDVVTCFQQGGPKGVPESRYTLFDHWMDDASSIRLKGQPPTLLTGNDDIKRILETSSAVCDVGCGGGADLCFLARDFPKCEFHGIDLSERAVTAAKSRAATMGLSNVTFHLADAIKMAELDEWKSKFDVVYCVDFVHDVGRPDLLLRGVRSMMKDDGYFVMNDVGVRTKCADNKGNPWSPIIYGMSMFRCLPTSLSQGEDSFGLGTAWGEERALALLKESGFDCVHVKNIGGVAIDVYCRKTLSQV